MNEWESRSGGVESPRPSPTPIRRRRDLVLGAATAVLVAQISALLFPSNRIDGPEMALRVFADWLGVLVLWRACDWSGRVLLVSQIGLAALSSGTISKALVHFYSADSGVSRTGSDFASLLAFYSVDWAARMSIYLLVFSLWAFSLTRTRPKPWMLLILLAELCIILAIPFQISVDI